MCATTAPPHTTLLRAPHTIAVRHSLASRRHNGRRHARRVVARRCRAPRCPCPLDARHWSRYARPPRRPSAAARAQRPLRLRRGPCRHAVRLMCDAVAPSRAEGRRQPCRRRAADAPHLTARATPIAPARALHARPRPRRRSCPRRRAGLDADALDVCTLHRHRPPLARRGQLDAPHLDGCRACCPAISRHRLASRHRRRFRRRVRCRCHRRRRRRRRRYIGCLGRRCCRHSCRMARLVV